MVLVRPDTTQVFVLNPSAAFIWSAFAGSQTIHSLVAIYGAHYQIPEAQAAIDVHATLNSWSETLLAPSYAPVSDPPTSSIPCTQPYFSADYKYCNFHFRLALHDHDFADEIVPRIAHLLCGSGPVTTTFHAFRSANHLHVFADAKPLTVQSETSVARTILLQEIARLAHTPDSQFLAILHAAAVGSAAEALLLAAPTHGGKSTLAAALTHAGFPLFSDDSAPIDPAFNVIPAPFALMLRTGSVSVLKQYFPDLEGAASVHRDGEPVRFLAPLTVLEPAPAIPKAIIYVNFQLNYRLSFEPLTAFESLLELQKSGFYLPHRESGIAAFLDRFQKLPAYRLTYSALSDAVGLLKQRF